MGSNGSKAAGHLSRPDHRSGSFGSSVGPSPGRVTRRRSLPTDITCDLRSVRPRSISTGSRIHRCNRIACGRRAPSAVRPEGKAFVENERGEGELVPFVTPRALQFEEMPYLARQSSVLRAVP